MFNTQLRDECDIVQTTMFLVGVEKDEPSHIHVPRPSRVGRSPSQLVERETRAQTQVERAAA